MIRECNSWIRRAQRASDTVTPFINKLVKKANVALKKSPCWKDVERTLGVALAGVVSRRGKNLGDLILILEKKNLFY